MFIIQANVIGTTLDDVWFKLLRQLYDHGRTNKIDSGSFEGKETTRLEFDFVGGVILYPTTRPLAPIMPEGISPVTTQDDIEKYFVEYIMDGENLRDNEHYRYATWISGGEYKLPKAECYALMHEGFRGRFTDLKMRVPNQVRWCINHYKEKGLYNNHCTIQVGYPESNFAYDIPYKDETDRQTSPCLRLIDTKIVNEDGKDYLLMNVYFRSWDLYSAWPENMGGLTLLMEYMAEEIGVEPGSLSFCSKGLHAYSHCIDILKQRLNILVPDELFELEDDK